MEEKALEDQWNILVDSHFVEMTRDIRAMVAIEDEVREELLIELGWKLSKKSFEDLMKGTPGTNRTSFAPLVGSTQVARVFIVLTHSRESDRWTDSSIFAGRYARKPSRSQPVRGRWQEGPRGKGQSGEEDGRAGRAS